MKSDLVNEKVLKLRSDVKAILESYTSDDSLVDNYIAAKTSIPCQFEISQKERLHRLRENIEIALDSKPVEQALQIFSLIISTAEEIEPLEVKTQLEIRDINSKIGIGMGGWEGQFELKARKESSVSYQFLTRMYKVGKDISTKQFIHFYLTTVTASGYSNLPISIIIHPTLRSILHKDRNEIDDLERVSLCNALQVINYFKKAVISKNNIITLFASKPNSGSILQYLFECITQLFDYKYLYQLFKISYVQAINNRRLSNLLSLLNIERTLSGRADFQFLTSINIHDLKLIPQHDEIFLENKKLRTQSPLIEIIKILGRNGLFPFLTERPKQYASSDDLDTLAVLSYYHITIRDLTDENIKKKSYNSFIDILTHGFNPTFVLNVFEGFPKMIFYADLEKVKVLRNFFNTEHYTLPIKTSDFIQKRLSVEMQNGIRETLQYYFPTVIAKIIQDYLPVLLEQMCRNIQNVLRWDIYWDYTDQIKLYVVLVPKQKQESSDCGYQTLFNALSMFKEISPYYPLQLFNNPPNNSEYQQKFDEFKSQVREYLTLTEDAHLNAWDLELVLKQALYNKKSSFSYFRGLSQYLTQLQLSEEAPPYTIINTSHAGEQKLDKSYLFGGSSYLNLRIAITFYILSLSINEPQLHCLLIGTQGHWYAEFLTMGFKSSEGIDSFYILKSAQTEQQTDAQVRDTINLQILDVLKNPLHFATNVAAQTLELAVQELEFLADQKPINDITTEKVYQHCQLIKQFFSVFAHTGKITNFGWALAQTQKIALKFNNLSSNFDNLVKEIKITQTQLNMFPLPKQPLTDNSKHHKKKTCLLM